MVFCSHSVPQKSQLQACSNYLNWSVPAMSEPIWKLREAANCELNTFIKMFSCEEPNRVRLDPIFCRTDRCEYLGESHI